MDINNSCNATNFKKALLQTQGLKLLWLKFSKTHYKLLGFIISSQKIKFYLKKQKLYHGLMPISVFFNIFNSIWNIWNQSLISAGLRWVILAFIFWKSWNKVTSGNWCNADLMKVKQWHCKCPLLDCIISNFWNGKYLNITCKLRNRGPFEAFNFLHFLWKLENNLKLKYKEKNKITKKN